jgi:20S proteasome subunit alpha 6
MKQQALASRMTYDRAISLSEIVGRIGARAQRNTQFYGRRPYGVGLLIAGVDGRGPHLYEFQPSGLTQEMVACAIGARSQMARTYLERNLDKFDNSSKDELVKHALRALKDSMSQDRELTIENTSVAIAGVKGEDFTPYEGQALSHWLDVTFFDTEEEAPEDEGMEVDG